MKEVTLTETQLWFFQLAIANMDSVLASAGIDNTKESVGIAYGDLVNELDDLDTELRKVEEEETEDI